MITFQENGELEAKTVSYDCPQMRGIMQKH